MEFLRSTSGNSSRFTLGNILELQRDSDSTSIRIFSIFLLFGIFPGILQSSFSNSLDSSGSSGTVPKNFIQQLLGTSSVFPPGILTELFQIFFSNDTSR